ncbi:MAG: hypothetical protein PHH33_08735 [Parabacteroides sp.]|nr:hypothetical protein [Parabacteroides sp.]
MSTTDSHYSFFFTSVLNQTDFTVSAGFSLAALYNFEKMPVTTIRRIRPNTLTNCQA